MGTTFMIYSFVDANLMSGLTTVIYKTGIIYLLNKTTIEWYSKTQSCVETATYGSEYAATCIRTEHIVDL